LRHNNKWLIVLDDVSFQIKAGEMFGIIGDNGSGKTTLLRILAGIYEPDSGVITIKGKLSPLLHMGTGFHKELVAEENIVISGMLMGIPKKEMKQKVEKIIKFAELEDFTYMKLKHYSAGMRARLAFSAAIETEPDILLVDEILSVGDIGFRKKSLERFLEFKKKGHTILYTTHSLNSVSRYCDRALLLDKGKIVMIGKASETVEKYREISEKK
jgi:ABC-type polysaccharide/polyol phosphate transport system ATPase subunit